MAWWLAAGNVSTSWSGLQKSCSPAKYKRSWHGRKPFGSVGSRLGVEFGGNVLTVSHVQKSGDLADQMVFIFVNMTIGIGH